MISAQIARGRALGGFLALSSGDFHPLTDFIFSIVGGWLFPPLPIFLPFCKEVYILLSLCNLKSAKFTEFLWQFFTVSEDKISEISSETIYKS